MSDTKQAIDIVIELRMAHDRERLTTNITTLFSRAADEIERLREHVAKRDNVIAKLTDDVMRIAKERDEARARIAELEEANDQAISAARELFAKVSEVTDYAYQSGMRKRFAWLDVKTGGDS